MSEKKKEGYDSWSYGQEKKKEAITMMAIYDYPNAIIAERQASIIVCVSDSGGMAVFGERKHDISHIWRVYDYDAKLFHVPAKQVWRCWICRIWASTHLLKELSKMLHALLQKAELK